MLKGKRTKIVAYLMLAMAVLGMLVDALNGGGFELAHHFAEIRLGLEGAGLLFLRKAIDALK